jgi:hypothetical protein
MAVDLQQLQQIHRLESEVDQARAGVKQLTPSRVDLIEALPGVAGTRGGPGRCRGSQGKAQNRRPRQPRPREAGRRIAEARFDLRDLREILSHALVLYTQQTGKVVIKEHDRTRQVELRARISKRLLGQERLPLGINRHLGQHFPIPVGMKVEGKPEEGE